MALQRTDAILALPRTIIQTILLAGFLVAFWLTLSWGGAVGTGSGLGTGALFVVKSLVNTSGQSARALRQAVAPGGKPGGKSQGKPVSESKVTVTLLAGESEAATLGVGGSEDRAGVATGAPGPHSLRSAGKHRKSNADKSEKPGDKKQNEAEKEKEKEKKNTTYPNANHIAYLHLTESEHWKKWGPKFQGGDWEWPGWHRTCGTHYPEEEQVQQGLCIPPAQPDLDFSRDSEAHRSFRELPLQPRVVCDGLRLLTRSCYFQDIVWDLQEERFVFFGSDKVDTAALGVEAQDPDEAWLRLELFKPTKGNRANRPDMHVDWRPSAEAPPPDTLVTSPLKAVHLRVMYHPTSIGHFIRDNLLPLVSLPSRFGLDPAEFTWLQAPSNRVYGSDFQAGSPTLKHYESWMPHTPGQPRSMLWSNFLYQASTAVASDNRPSDGEGAAEHRSDGSDDGNVKTNVRKRYIRFPKLVAGRGSTSEITLMHRPTGPEEDAKTVLQWAAQCGPWPWKDLRELVYGNVGVKHTPARELAPQVTFIDGQRSERRSFPDVKEDILPGLQKDLPDAEVVYTQISALSGEEQIEILARTTVLVTTIGSRSFRLPFLPDGAQVILVGPPEFYGPKGKTKFVMPFYEPEMCWSFLGYVHVLLYHVREPEDLLSGTLVQEEMGQARNSSPRLRYHRVVPLLRQALDTIASERASHKAPLGL